MFEKGSSENKRAEVRFSPGNLRGRIIVETKKSLVLCERCFDEDYKYLERFTDI